MAANSLEVYQTFYTRQAAARPQLPDDPDWDFIRTVADTWLFGDDVKRQIRFGALSLDERGPGKYGDCTVVLKKEKFVCDRSSAFEENSLLFVKRHHVSFWDTRDILKGRRSTWDDRHLLAAAKLHQRINPDTAEDEFPKILLPPGTPPGEEDFIEIHVFGPITVMAFLKVTVAQTGADESAATLKFLEEAFESAGVEFQVIDAAGRDTKEPR
jgi:hypothetical protein